MGEVGTRQTILISKEMQDLAAIRNKERMKFLPRWNRERMVIYSLPQFSIKCTTPTLIY